MIKPLKFTIILFFYTYLLSTFYFITMNKEYMKKKKKEMGVVNTFINVDVECV